MVLITGLVIGVMLIAHRNVGRAAGRQVLRGMAAALSGFATSSYVLSLDWHEQACLSLMAAPLYVPRLGRITKAGNRYLRTLLIRSTRRSRCSGQERAHGMGHAGKRR